MGNSHSNFNNFDKSNQDGKNSKKEKKYEPPVIGYRHSMKNSSSGFDFLTQSSKLPSSSSQISKIKCKLQLLTANRVKDYLEIEKQFVSFKISTKSSKLNREEEDAKLSDLRGSVISIGTLEELIDENHAIISTSITSEHYVSILSIVDRSLLEAGCSVLLNHKVHAIVGILLDHEDPLVSTMKLQKIPQESYSQIGGLEDQIREIKESVELPLTHPEYYEELGINAPKGVILFGPPGSGKTLLVKAVANQSNATFLRVVGSELIQKYSGEGPRLVRQMFKMASENSPSIIFIDEIDAIGSKRFDSNSGGEREIQRTMLELLNQLDGFDYLTDVKVIMATNRIESLDPALIRPGRIDRKIEFFMPDTSTKMQIFNIHTSKMTLDENVNAIEYLQTKENLSGADIKAMCSEAGMIALRQRRLKVTHEDFKKAKQVILHLKKDNTPEGMYV